MPVSPLIFSTLFFVFAGVALIGALSMILFKNPLYSTLSLIITFLSLSGIYILLNAQVIAVINIIVYAGAIMVLFIFVIMLINVKEEKNRVKESNTRWLLYLGIPSVVGMLAIIIALFYRQQVVSSVANIIAAQTPIGYVEVLGTTLFTEYLFPFELTGILFLTALIGAVMLGKK